MQIRVGFTGTQHGMSPRQRLVLLRALHKYDVVEVHHGDCIGADAEVARAAHNLNIQVVIHPPTDPKKRAWTQLRGDLVMPEAPYLDRNHNIVDAVDILFAAPHTDNEVLRSGTWSTVRYARQKGTPVILLKR